MRALIVIFYIVLGLFLLGTMIYITQTDEQKQLVEQQQARPAAAVSLEEVR